MPGHTDTAPSGLHKRFAEDHILEPEKSGILEEEADYEDETRYDDDVLSRSFSMSIKSMVEFIYALFPFVIFMYALQVYRTPVLEKDVRYYPDFSTTDDEHSDIQLNVEFYDLKDYESTASGWTNNERVLFLVPLRDASAHLPMFFAHLTNMTYPHHLIDISFLISDTSDSTVPDLKNFLNEYQSHVSEEDKFGHIDIYEKDFGQIVGQSFSDRHGFQAQGPRRKKMAIARNWLLSTAIKPYHSWVYWRDIDVETCPSTILEDLMHHNKDVIVPNIWRPLPDWLGGEQAYDLNSWQESEGGIELADSLDEDAVIVEGYAEYATWRPHLAYLRDPYGDPEVEIELDGIGGVSILSKAKVFKDGAMFPAFSYKKHAETEAFGKLCKTMGFDVIGLPHYVIWHIYEPSTDDLKHMEWLASEEIRQKENLKNQVVFEKAWKSMFRSVNEDWEREKYDVFKNNDLSKLNLGSVDWDDVDEFLVEVDENERSVDYDGTDDQFLVAFDTNNNLEKHILAQLKSSGPIKFGHTKKEHQFTDFNSIGPGSRHRPMRFKKLTAAPEDEVNTQPMEGDQEAVVEVEEDNSLEGKYDLNSDQIVDGDSSDKIVDNTKDKQLFNDLENNKNELDGEEEGGVEFKSQKLVEEAEKELKSKTKKKVKKEKAVKKIKIYEVEDGVTIGTVVQTLASPQATKFDDANVREALDEVIDVPPAETSVPKKKRAQPKHKEVVEDDNISNLGNVFDDDEEEEEEE